MNKQELFESFHPLERKVFPLLRNHEDAETLMDASGLQEVEVMRALQWLQNKKLIVVKTKEETSVILGKNGRSYVKQGLPEKQFLDVLDKPLTLSLIAEKSKLTEYGNDLTIPSSGC